MAACGQRATLGFNLNKLVRGFAAGNNYLGADFGYQVFGSSYGLFGDHLWIDQNGNGALGFFKRNRVF